MSEKKLFTRIQQKMDTKANWDKATNFVPLKGEIIVYSDLNEMKVGDGTTLVKDLPFITSVRHSKVGNSGNASGSYVYYKLASFPADNNFNACSLIVDGRIGGWNSDNKGYLSMMISNRDGIHATGTLAGDADLNLCNLVLYTTGDTSTDDGTTTLYIKTHGYFAFDLTLRAMNNVVDLWDGQGIAIPPGVSSYPPGSFSWSLSADIDKFLQVKNNGDLKDLKVGGSLLVKGDLTVYGETLHPDGNYHGAYSANNNGDQTVLDFEANTRSSNGCIVMAHGKIVNQSGYINITRLSTVYTDYDSFALQSGEDGYWGSSWVTATAFFPPNERVYVHARGAEQIYVREYAL